MSLQQTISEEDNRTIADLQAKYGSGPFLAADAVVQSRDGHVLLIQRGNPPSKGVHALPGGKLDDGETFYQAALRELMEETGLVSVVGGRVEQIDWDSALAGYVVND
ncbi:MAG: NUDIX domain-containing protein, partial [Mesorhizobium sp.]